MFYLFFFLFCSFLFLQPESNDDKLDINDDIDDNQNNQNNEKDEDGNDSRGESTLDGKNE